MIQGCQTVLKFSSIKYHTPVLRSVEFPVLAVPLLNIITAAIKKSEETNANAIIKIYEIRLDIRVANTYDALINNNYCRQ